MNTDNTQSDRIGRFREILGAIAEGVASADMASEYRELRARLLEDQQINPLLPEFVVECRTPRDFLNYIQRAFKTYKDRSLYIEAQLSPIERQFRPERQNPLAFVRRRCVLSTHQSDLLGARELSSYRRPELPNCVP